MGGLKNLWVAVALFGACVPAIEGPGEIVWGRDVCVRCQMVISDRKNAAQLRTAGDHHLHYFDDLGCALLWEREQARLGHRIEEFWVPNPVTDGWQDANRARYSDGHQTPMNHEFSVSDTSDSSEGFGLEWVRQRVVERESERRSARR